MHDYVRTSLELHLFFARIMKEHALFLQAGFMPKNTQYIQDAMMYRKEFEKLLSEVVKISNHLISSETLESGEIVTEFTFEAERQTERLTGIIIDSDITLQELKLSSCNHNMKQNMSGYVSRLNNRAIQLLNGLICLKEKLLADVLNCKVFTANYPLLIEHILREAKLYRQYVKAIQNRQNTNCLKQEEIFWNQIMMEHALFIRGLLDPTENELIVTADTFAKEYKKLLAESKDMTRENIRCVTNRTIEETCKYIDFKTAGTKGIEECEIKSIILPLLADHVLREANHYLRILKH